MIVPNHLWATWSVWLCLYLQRLCPLLYYFFLSMCSGRFLAPATWQCVCSPQPITVKVWELDQLPGCKLLISLGGRGGRAYLDSCIYKPQPTNPTCFLPLASWKPSDSKSSTLIGEWKNPETEISGQLSERETGAFVLHSMLCYFEPTGVVISIYLNAEMLHTIFSIWYKTIQKHHKLQHLLTLPQRNWLWWVESIQVHNDIS